MNTQKFTSRNKSLNLDITNRCNLKCPGCSRQKHFSGKNIPGSDIDLESWEKITDYFDTISLCGQISDPTLHNDFFRLLDIALSKKVKLEIHVASSFRSKSWFTRAFFLTMGHNVEWIFGIDGLPEDSNKYRINQDGKKLYEIMCKCASLGNKTIWQYIVFNYNENYVDRCLKLAKDNNITFKKIISSRWKGIEYLKPSSKENYLSRNF